MQNAWSLAPCESPGGLVCDGAHQRLFSVCDNRLMIVSDAMDDHQVARVTLRKGPDAVAFDPQMQLICSSNPTTAR